MSRKKRPFSSTKQLNELIAQYFNETDPQNEGGDKPREMETPTLAGLAFFLGFNSRHEFEACETSGKYALTLQRARLRIEAVYEKKLHDSSGGAVFALKSMGRNEQESKQFPAGADNNLKIQIVRSGPKLASSEKDVTL